MMLTFDLAEIVAENLQKIIIGGQDDAVGRELYNRLGAIDRGDLPGGVNRLQLCVGDVRGELD